MRRIAAAATAIVCAATLVACSGSDAGEGASPSPTASDVVETPEESATPEETDATDTTDPAAADPSMPGSIEELAAMSQAAIEEAGMTEISTGDVTVSLGYSARGSALVITCTLSEGMDLTGSEAEFQAAMEPMLAPMAEQLLPMVREVDPDATVIIEALQQSGEVLYSKTFE